MSVRDWPTYLLRDIPDATRAAIEEDAERDGVALIEVIREILCAHYSLDCEQVDSRRRSLVPGTSTMYLRLQPELWEAIKADAGPGYGAIDKTVQAILAAHYNGGHPHD